MRNLKPVSGEEGRPYTTAGRHADPPSPHRPTTWQLQQFGRRFPPHYLHQSWLDYLYWDIDLEP